MSAGRVLLICPDHRPGMDFLRESGPLALRTFLGKPLLDHALDGLARSGTTEALLLASDRPAEIREFVRDGHPWGLKLRVVTESAELSPADAAAKHASFSPEKVLNLDFLPQAPDCPVLRDGPVSWHAARQTLLPLLAPTLVGTREIQPGVWLGLRCRVDSTAVLTAPCWIGPGVRVGRGAKVRGFVEEGSVIDHHAEVNDSTVEPFTYLGGMTRLGNSLAAGPSLLDLRSGSLTKLTDAFLLSALAAPRAPAASPAARLAAALVMLLTSPVLALAALVSALRGRPLFEASEAVLPAEGPGRPRGRATHRVFAAFSGVWRRWPRLWNVALGEFAWTGNPPLTPAEAGELTGEFENLWLSIPPGVFTAPEAEGAFTPWDDEARAHAALFACGSDSAYRRRVLLSGLFPKRFGHPRPPSPDSITLTERPSTATSSTTPEKITA